VTYFKNAMGIVLMYDCTDENSFDNLRYWISQVKLHAGENVPTVLVGNKCDRPDKRVSTEQGETLARELGVQFFEASAKDNINVQEVFYSLVKAIEHKRLGEVPGARASFRLNSSQQRSKSGCCK